MYSCVKFVYMRPCARISATPPTQVSPYQGYNFVSSNFDFFHVLYFAANFITPASLFLFFFEKKCSEIFQPEALKAY